MIIVTFGVFANLVHSSLEIEIQSVSQNDSGSIVSSSEENSSTPLISFSSHQCPLSDNNHSQSSHGCCHGHAHYMLSQQIGWQVLEIKNGFTSDFESFWPDRSIDVPLRPPIV